MIFSEAVSNTQVWTITTRATEGGGEAAPTSWTPHTTHTAIPTSNSTSATLVASPVSGLAYVGGDVL